MKKNCVDYLLIDFQKKFKKHYEDPIEEAMRREVWGQVMRLIKKHNKEYYKGLHTFKMGLNHRSDWVSKIIYLIISRATLKKVA